MKYTTRYSVHEKPLAAEALAIILQRYTRGVIARRVVQLLIWERYQRSAFVIQNIYRRYRLNDRFNSIIRHSIQNKRNKNDKILEYQNDQEILSKEGKLKKTIIDKIQSSRTTFDDKVFFWRKAIELRRAHGKYPTDVIIKSLIASKGNLNRGLILIGNEAFALREMSDLSTKTRNLYLPIITVDDSGYAFELDDTVNPLYMQNLVQSGQVDVVRALKLRKEVQHSEDIIRKNKLNRNEYCEGGVNVSDVVSKCYFSKHYQGNNILPRKPKYVEAAKYSSFNISNRSFNADASAVFKSRSQFDQINGAMSKSP